MKKTLLTMIALLSFATSALALTISSSVDHAASATFTSSGDYLYLTLTNTSTSDATKPSDLLQAVFFTIGSTDLTPLSALLNTDPSSAVYRNGIVTLGPGGNVGGEWAYANTIYGQGIGAAGLGLFGNGNFNGPDLNGQTAVNGMSFGITSAGDNLATGNGGKKGPLFKNELIKSSVNFTLTGFDGLLTEDITNVWFQYGTDLTPPSQEDSEDPEDPETPPVPEPGTMMLLGVGLFGLAVYGKRRMHKDS